MKKYCFIPLISMALFFLCLSAPAQTAQGPKMVLKEREFDFKKVREGEVISHAFEVQSEGDQDLEIIRVKPG